MAYADLNDVIELAEGADLQRRRARARQAPGGAAGCSSATRRSSRTSRRRSRALTYDEAATLPEGEGPAVRVRHRPRRHRRNRAVGAVRSARSCVTHYPAAVKAFYMKPDPAAAGQGALRGRARAGRLRRDHRRRPAPRRFRPAARSGSRSTTCRRRRSSGTSISAATARCRTAASAWASSACVAGSAGSNTCARRSPIRGCCTGCTRKHG